MPSLKTDSYQKISDYQHIFLQDLPLIDVRAPIEFEQGAFPCSTNLPLMNNQERAEVGICYKQEGQKAAVELGHSLVQGKTRQQRLEQWLAFCQANPQGHLYCLRGGLRSHIVQHWLKEAGVNYPLIQGGYKALRRYLIHTTEHAVAKPMYIVAGNTGCGKTRLIKAFEQGVDLEGLAKHRGSSFGRLLESQSNQVDFENRLAITFLKKQAAGHKTWVIEDEGRIIGSNHLPLELYQRMTHAPIVLIQDPFDVRLQRLKEEYIDDMSQQFISFYGEEQGWQKFTEYLQHGIYAIRKRLGSERYQQLANTLESALQQHQKTNQSEHHCAWLTPLLTDYYDPMYTYQMSKKTERIVFQGNYDDVQNYLKHYLAKDMM